MKILRVYEDGSINSYVYLHLLLVMLAIAFSYSCSEGCPYFQVYPFIRTLYFKGGNQTCVHQTISNKSKNEGGMKKSTSSVQWHWFGIAIEVVKEGRHLQSDLGQNLNRQRKNCIWGWGGSGHEYLPAWVPLGC